MRILVLGLTLLSACASSANYLDPKMDMQDESTPAPESKPSWTKTGESSIIRPDQKTELPARAADQEDFASVPAPPGPPIITLPGFRLLDGGRSRVFLRVGGKVNISESSTDRSLTYHLSGVVVPEKVNRLPLPASGFGSPVQRIIVRPAADGADLVIELRAKSPHDTQLKRSPFGTRLVVEFPRLAEEQGEVAETIPLVPDEAGRRVGEHRGKRIKDAKGATGVNKPKGYKSGDKSD